MTFVDKPFPKTHDLADLIERASRHEPLFRAWLDRISPLTDYAAGMRYPDFTMTLTPEEYTQAESAAADFYTFVCDLIPAEAHPPE